MANETLAVTSAPTTGVTAMVQVPSQPDTLWTTIQHSGPFPAMGTILGVWIWLEKKMADRKAKDTADLDARIRPLEEASKTFKSKEQLAEDRRALEKDIEDVRHDLKNESMRVDQLDQLRQQADRWQAQKDVTIANLEKGLERVEGKIDKNHAETMEAIKARP